MFSVLNLYGRVIGFDDGGLEQFSFVKVMQQGERVGCGLHPVALGGTWNDHVLSSKDLLLAVIGKSVVKFANDDFCQQARAGVAAGNWRAWFFSGDYVLLALRASASFLVMVENFEGSANHLQLMSEKSC